jgi:hypothetical protein
VDVGGPVVLPVHVDGDTVKLGNAGHQCKLPIGSITHRCQVVLAFETPSHALVVDGGATLGLQGALISCAR